jgi:ABC-type polysaccharide/polyol phosphate transport system ATPase subunit
MSAALVFDRVGKDYRDARYGALRDDVAAAAARLVGVKRNGPSRITALDEVSFEIKQGEAFGLIGSNGAGKTTALKLATRITYPTRGTVRVRGRVGGLIHVDTGLHPELTGRENVHLYGRILGLSGRDIARRFDEIVEFSGVAPAIDQPVKHFSSGMTLRLGFSIAAHLEPDVLLVDEALAVGDASFQHRCIGKMSELRDAGHTLVFVSHSMVSVEALCSRVGLLDHGHLVAEGHPRDVIRRYLQTVEERRAEAATTGHLTGPLTIERVSLHGSDGREIDEATTGEPLTVRLHYVAHEPLSRPHFNVVVANDRHSPLFAATMLYDGECPELLHGRGALDCTFATLALRPRSYEIWCGVKSGDGVAPLLDYSFMRRFRVSGEAEGPGKAGVASGAALPPVHVPYEWRLNRRVTDGDR